MRSVFGFLLLLLGVFLLGTALVRAGFIADMTWAAIVMPIVIIAFALGLLFYTPGGTGVPSWLTAKHVLYAALMVLAVGLLHGFYNWTTHKFQFSAVAFDKRQQELDLRTSRKIDPPGLENRYDCRQRKAEDEAYVTSRKSAEEEVLKRDWMAGKMTTEQYYTRSKAVSDRQTKNLKLIRLKEYDCTGEPVTADTQIADTRAGFLWGLTLPKFNFDLDYSKFDGWNGLQIAMLFLIVILAVFTLINALRGKWRMGLLNIAWIVVVSFFLGLALHRGWGDTTYVHAEKAPVAYRVPAPPVRGVTDEKLVTADQLQDWYDTGVDVLSDQEFLVTDFTLRNGSMSVCRLGNGCDFQQLQGKLICPNWEHMVLIGKVGNGPVFKLGAFQRMRVSELGTGRFKIFVNQVDDDAAFVNMKGGVRYKLQPAI